MTITSLIVPDQTTLQSFSDSELLALQADIAAWCRQATTAAAQVAGEVARRCAPELGDDGLAQRTGMRTPEALIQQVTGVTRVEARGLLRVGEMLATPSPWLSTVVAAVGDGSLSVAAADAIATGLGTPTSTVAADDLADAASRLVDAAHHSPPERIAAAARAIRDDLDSEGVADREEHLRSKRYLRLIPRPDGSVRIDGLLDQESGALLTAAVDAVTAPRRGGPRFVDPGRAAAGQRIVDDSRTTEQIAADALVDMVRIATHADPGTVFPQKQPSVRVHVTLADLERRAAQVAARLGTAPTYTAATATATATDSGCDGDGVTYGATLGGSTIDDVGDGERRNDSHSGGFGTIEGTTTSVSLATVERLACESGYIPILFDQGQPLDVGRSQRLFTRTQRIALAARDGGCIAPGCDRPPSWCEAHHINHWYRDHGKTDTADGVLLCHHHHLLFHNHGWEITRDGDYYWVIPPASIDPDRTPRPAQKRRRLVSSSRE